MSNFAELDKQLNKAKIELLTDARAAFISTIIFSLKFKWDDTLQPPTAAVDHDTIYFHPDFWKSINDKERVAVLAHEGWHVAFNHVINMHDYKDMNSVKYNIAADHVINLMLEESGYQLPSFALKDKQYKDMSTMQIYNLLPDPPSDTGNDSLIGDIKPKGDKPSPEKLQQQRNAIEDIIVKAHTIAQATDPNGVGSLPGDVQIFIDKLLNPKLDWRTITQNIVSSFVRTDYSYKRPNRRYMPDYYLPSLYNEGMGELCAAFDTSGSVSDEEIKMFLTEVISFKEILSPALTTIIDFDTSIKNVHKFTADENIKGIALTGRGGTCLKCVFDYYNKNIPNLLVVFSDLQCPPIQEDPGYPVIWVCVNNPKAKVNFGTLIHYSTDN